MVSLIRRDLILSNTLSFKNDDVFPISDCTESAGCCEDTEQILYPVELTDAKMPVYYDVAVRISISSYLINGQLHNS